MKDNASIKLLAVFIATVIVVSAMPSAIGEIENENLYQSSISVPSTIKVLMLNGSVIPMNLDEYLKGVVSAEMSQIIVEDADTIWNTTTAYSSDLAEVAINVTPRVLTEYANSIYHNDLDEIPTELTNLTNEVPANRLIIEYATSAWSTSLSPPPFIKPEVKVSTDKTEYAPGDTMTVTLAFRNPWNYAVNTYFLWYFGLPDYDYWIPVMRTPFTLSPDYNQSFDVYMPIDTWSAYSFNASWYVALYNATTFELISEDTADWRYVPTKMAKGEIMPEEIAKELKGALEEMEKEADKGFLRIGGDKR